MFLLTPPHRSSSVNLLHNNLSEMSPGFRRRDSPITVAKTVKLRAELCRAAVCSPSFGMKHKPRQQNRITDRDPGGPISTRVSPVSPLGAPGASRCYAPDSYLLPLPSGPAASAASAGVLLGTESPDGKVSLSLQAPLGDGWGVAIPCQRVI